MAAWLHGYLERTMDCCQCEGIETLFNEKEAKHKLKVYRKDGPAKTTRMLVEALRVEGVQGLTLLDIGGGVGAI
jgi:magnesium-protoporphyrin O-methyltransferase